MAPKKCWRLPATWSASVPPVLGVPGTTRQRLASSGYASISRLIARSSRVMSVSMIDRSMRRGYSRRSARAISLREVLFGLEDGFNGASEEPSDPEGEREARVVATGLDRVHRLARDGQQLGEVRLGPMPFNAEEPDAILHVQHVKQTLHNVNQALHRIGEGCDSLRIAPGSLKERQLAIQGP